MHTVNEFYEAASRPETQSGPSSKGHGEGDASADLVQTAGRSVSSLQCACDARARLRGRRVAVCLRCW